MKKHFYFGMMIFALALAVMLAGCGGGSVSPSGDPGGTPSPFKVVFTSDRNNSPGVYNIFIMNSDGTGVTALTKDASSTISYSCPELSPDRSKVVYVGNEGSTYKIYVTNADGTGTAKSVYGNSGTGLNASWTPAGKIIFFYSYIYYVSGDGTVAKARSDLYIMDADGSNLTKISTTSVSTDPGFFANWGSAPRMSPDGTKILYESGSSIYTADFSGTSISNQKTIHDYSTTNSDAYEPSWSPDGQTIIFEAYNTAVSDGSYTYYDIYKVSASGGTETALTSKCWAYVPLYSPNGTKIIFSDHSTDTNSYDVFSINADGSGRTNLTNNSALDGYSGYENDSNISTTTTASLAVRSVQKKLRK